MRRCFEKIARKHALEILNTHQKENPKLVYEHINKEQPIIEQGKPGQEFSKTPIINSESQEAETANSLKNQGIDFADKTSEQKTPQQSKNGKEGERENDAIPLGTFDAKEASQLIELKNQTKLVFQAANDPDEENLKKYLGNPIFDDMHERRYKKPFIGTFFSIAFFIKII